MHRHQSGRPLSCSSLPGHVRRFLVCRGFTRHIRLDNHVSNRAAVIRNARRPQSSTLVHGSWGVSRRPRHVWHRPCSRSSRNCPFCNRQRNRHRDVPSRGRTSRKPCRWRAQRPRHEHFRCGWKHWFCHWSNTCGSVSRNVWYGGHRRVPCPCSCVRNLLARSEQTISVLRPRRCKSRCQQRWKGPLGDLLGSYSFSQHTFNHLLRLPGVHTAFRCQRSWPT